MLHLLGSYLHATSTPSCVGGGGGPAKATDVACGTKDDTVVSFPLRVMLRNMFMLK